MKKDCQNKEACQFQASREFFGNSECPGTKDAGMALWLIYSCDGGGSDETTSHNATCSTGSCDDLEQGEMKQVDIPGCGGWVKLDCNGGCINILKVLNSSLRKGRKYCPFYTRGGGFSGCSIFTKLIKNKKNKFSDQVSYETFKTCFRIEKLLKVHVYSRHERALFQPFSNVKSVSGLMAPTPTFKLKH